MRGRLLVIVLSMVGVLAVGLGVPLALADARAEQQKLFIERLTDTTFFASIAERPIIEDAPAGLAADLARYDEVYGIAIAVIARDGTLFAASRRDPPIAGAQVAERVARAQANRRSETYPLLLPWNSDPLVLAEPVLIDGEVRAVAVTVSPTDDVRATELRSWLVVAGAAVLALGVAVLLALPVVGWTLRPVRRLDDATGRVAASVLAGGDAEPVSDGRGPPELRRLSASFDRMVATVGRAVRVQRSFVADASHQLRNPLTALRLRLSNLEGHVTSDAAEDHVAATAEVERLTELLDGLLALARAERTERNEVVDVDAAVADRLDAWRPLAEHSGLTLARAGAEGLSVLAPAGAIETVLDAVLDNAVKFAANGSGAGAPTGPARRITVAVARDGPAGPVELAVADCGPGMRADELVRATDRFWRSPEQSNAEGSGLGLAIAARTVEQAGGRLGLELPTGGGLRVVTRWVSAGPGTGGPGRRGERGRAADGPVDGGPVDPVSPAP